MNEDKGSLLAAVAGGLLLFPAIASAYTDPGTGAYLVQTLAVIAGAATFYLSHPRRLIRALVQRIGRRRRGP